MRRGNWLLGVALSLVLLASLAVPALAVSPAPQPHSFYGTLTMNGSDIPAGAEVVAVVEGGGGSIITTVDGQYGSPEPFGAKLVVSGYIERGALIEFYVDEVKANETFAFKSGTEKNLDLTVPAPETFTITATAGEGGAIDPSGDVVVESGADQAFAITPDPGYAVDDVLVDDASVGSVESYTFENVTDNHTIHASFAVETFTITATAGEGGAIDPSGDVVVNYGADQAFAITPDPGYAVDDVLVDDVSVGAVTSYPFVNVTDNHTIHATFALQTFTITATASDNGAIEPSGDVVVESGADQAFAITPDPGYAVDDVLVDDVSVGAVESYPFENVTDNHTIHASFVFVVETFTITATAGENGAIEPSGDVVVESGADQAFTITADPDYDVADVLVDYVSVGAVPSYTFENVTANHTIEATFEGVPIHFTTTLPAGWNLLSTPIKLDADSDSLEQILGESLADIEASWRWDAQNQQWEVPTGYELSPLEAVYLKVSSNASATAEFVPYQDYSELPSRELQPGLNLIGPAPAFDSEAGVFPDMPLDQALITIAEAGNLTGYTIVVSPEHNQLGWTYALGGEVKDLVPFKGYWVVMENADTMYGFSYTPVTP